MDNQSITPDEYEHLRTFHRSLASRIFGVPESLLLSDEQSSPDTDREEKQPKIFYGIWYPGDIRETYYETREDAREDARRWVLAHRTPLDRVLCGYYFKVVE